MIVSSLDGIKGGNGDYNSHTQDNPAPTSKPSMMANTVKTPAVAAPATPARSADSKNAAVVKEPFVMPNAAVIKKTAAGDAPPQEHHANRGKNASLHAPRSIVAASL